MSFLRSKLEMLYVNPAIKIPKSELAFSFAKSPGPGGQNVNKLNTKAILKWNVATTTAVKSDVIERLRRLYGTRINQRDELVIASHEHRDQASNIDACLDRLKDMLLKAAVVPKSRRATRPTAGAKRRRLEAKKFQAEKKRRRSLNTERD